MKGPCGNEQDVIGPHRSILGVDGRAFDNRQEVPLHSLAGDVGAVCFPSSYLVYLVEKNDARILDALERFFDDLVHVDELRSLFLDEDPECIRHLGLPLLCFVREHASQHFL